MSTVRVKVKRLRPEALLPEYMTNGAAAMDICACLPEGLRWLGPGERGVIPTGLAFELPEGYEMQVRSRSGLALTSGVCVANSPGTIDSDYRGELGVVLINHGRADFIVRHGDRIAQLVVLPVPRVELEEVDRLGATERGSGGFGSTGQS